MLKPFFFEEYVDLYERGIIPFNKERIQLVEYLKKEILIRDDIYFDEEMLQKYVLFSEKNFFPLAKYQKFKSSPDSCVKCYTMFLPFLLIKIDVFS
ncbi:hypothetical protein [Enterococcus faecalis]|uniref:hypothetical protein n=1 Tax=Enterococcus faecalis TaxID=1351 RepID=UPI0006679F1D|nr:hypothetical protein [Enterococcus faecalis]